MVVSCCVSGCTQRYKPGMSFYRFPTDKSRRHMWLKRITRGEFGDKNTAWQPSDYDRVCGKHFIKETMLLNEKQNYALAIAKEGHNFLLMGSAGTGKTHVLTEIYDQLSKAGKNVQLTCSTGIACTAYPTRYNAVTVHQFSGIDDGRHDPNQIISVIQNTPKYDHIIKNIMSTDVLIVDECSMISKRTFDSLNNVCRMKDSTKVFGGFQIIFSGDFLQLPPVPNKRYSDDGSYCFQSSHFRNVFSHHITLIENVRQSEQLFVQMLSEIYQGILSERSMLLIKNLTRPLPEGCDSVKLFSTNLLVDEYNRNCLLTHVGDMFEFQATDSGDTGELKNLTAPKTLWLKVGCPVILLRNLSNTLVNGLRGILVGVSDTELAVKFPALDLTTSIKKFQFTVFDPKKTTNVATREQFPVKPAFALTIHKAQGMTLPWVEIDCRDIFKTGQLGVAMSRARSADGLRVINFHPRYIYRPPTVVTQFMSQISEDTLPDLSCCRFRRTQSDEQQHTVAEISTVSSPDSSETELDELDDDFNNVIASIDRDEQNALNFDIPENFDMIALFAKITFKKEITQSHMRINALLAKLEPENPLLITFVKKLFFKMSTFIKSLKLDMQNAGSIPESTLAKFFNQVHEYTTSLEYIMSCLIMFDIGTERSFEDEHKIICYRITECIREFVIEQKVTELQCNSMKVPKRFVTDASRPRIRYVAGYCVAALRKRYTQIKQSKMFSHSKEAQSAFREAKISINIINLLKEEEHYLKETTTDRESLTDTERKQNVNRGLTNVTDSVFDFFLCLTNTCLSKLVHENLVNYGESMYKMCLDVVKSDSNLYEKFSHMVILRLHTENIEEFHDNNMNLSEHLETMVITSAQIYHIYNELVRKYFMVLFAQFCRDVKAAFKIQKTMAHRKQIKVAKSTETSTATNSSVKPTKQMGDKTNKSKPDAEKSAAMSQPDPKPGASVASGNELKSGTSDSDTCVKCHTGEGNDWIQCDGCNSWLHRKCAGLSNYKKWKKFSKESVSWFCKDCE